MSTMNDYYFHRIRKRQKHNTTLTTLNIIQKLLVVISVYLVFGLLFQHVYASIKTDTNNEISDPYQTRHGSVWLLPVNGQNKAHIDGNYIEAMQLHTDVDYEITGPIARAKIQQRFKNNRQAAVCVH